MALTSGERTTLVAAFWNALTAAYTATGSFGAWVNNLITNLVAALAAYYNSLIVNPEASTRVQVYQYSYFTKTIAQDLSTATDVWFAIKASKNDTDAQAKVLISKSVGLEYLNGAAATGMAALGSLTVGSSLVITIKHAATSLLDYMANGWWEVKILNASGNAQRVSGACGEAEILKAVVRRVA
jgi:hypothetical protein